MDGPKYSEKYNAQVCFTPFYNDSTGEPSNDDMVSVNSVMQIRKHLFTSPNVVEGSKDCVVKSKESLYENCEAIEDKENILMESANNGKLYVPSSSCTQANCGEFNGSVSSVTENDRGSATYLESSICTSHASAINDPLKALVPPKPLESETGRELKVYLRIRPFTRDEIDNDENCEDLMNVDLQTNRVTLRPPKDSFLARNTHRSNTSSQSISAKSYDFSHIFEKETSQYELFSKSALELASSFLNSQNCLLFTYGITNAGKTYTIQGIPEDGGVLPRTIDVIFNSVGDKQSPATCFKPKYYSSVEVLEDQQGTEEHELAEQIIQRSKKESRETMANYNCKIEPDHETIQTLMKECEQMIHSEAHNEGRGEEVPIVNKVSATEACDIDQGSPFADVDSEWVSRITDETVVPLENEFEYMVFVSYCEIYNELIYDILEEPPQKKGQRRPTLKLAEDVLGNVYVKGLKTVRVHNAEQTYKLLRIGQKNRKVAMTQLNQTSSRSHSVFTLILLRVPHRRRSSVDDLSSFQSLASRVVCNRFSFVDLAGSERYTRTKNIGKRLKEAANINTSLMTLGKCMEFLRWNQQHANNPKIVPFRESKLTRLFQSYFSAGCISDFGSKAVMIVNINQCKTDFDETFHVLRFSAIAKDVVTSLPIGNPKQEVKVKGNPSKKSLRLGKSKPNLESVPEEATDNELYETLREQSKINRLLTEENEKLLERLNQMREQLEQAEKRFISMEQNIREEVSIEMARQLVEMEQSLRLCMKEDNQFSEDLFDEKWNLYNKTASGGKCSVEEEGVVKGIENDSVPYSVFLAQQRQCQQHETTVEDLERIIEEQRRFIESTAKPEAESAMDVPVQQEKRKPRRTGCKFVDQKVAEIEARISQSSQSRNDCINTFQKVGSLNGTDFNSPVNATPELTPLGRKPTSKDSASSDRVSSFGKLKRLFSPSPRSQNRKTVAKATSSGTKNSSSLAPNCRSEDSSGECTSKGKANAKGKKKLFSPIARRLRSRKGDDCSKVLVK
eukprot:Nk52_evm21s270 gene=Nk52_evmTU21s270